MLRRNAGAVAVTVIAAAALVAATHAGVALSYGGHLSFRALMLTVVYGELPAQSATAASRVEAWAPRAHSLARLVSIPNRREPVRCGF
jgi:hypothetical protein